MRLRPLRRLPWRPATLVLAVPLAVGCGIRVLRDFSGATAQTVVLDDKCGLQEYFDTLGSRKIEPPRIAASSEIDRENSDRPAGGRTTFAFETDFQLTNFRRMLRQNWKNLPPEVLTANPLLLEVRWAEKAGIRRVITTDPATLMVGAEEWSLPYHVCLSDYLFGEPLYRTRREMLGLPALPPAPPAPGPDAAPRALTDAGADATAGGRSDAARD